MFRSKRVAIDLGTSNCLVMDEQGNVLVNEPTVVAYSVLDKKVLAVGSQAKQMLGKVPTGVEALRPLQSGGIASYKATEALLKTFLGMALGKSFVKPEVVISVPAGLTSVEERAVIRALEAVGVRKSYLLPEPIAAALGAELPIHLPSGNMIVNLGGGTAEIAVIASNGIIKSVSKRGSGDALNLAIVDYIRRREDLIIGEEMAERVKMKVGSAIKLETPLVMEVKGRDLISGLPRAIGVDSNSLVEGIKPVLVEIILEVKNILEQTPPEVASDIVDQGIVLSGGTSQLRNIDQLMSTAIGVPVFLAEEPLFCVVRGLKTVLADVDGYKLAFKN